MGIFNRIQEGWREGRNEHKFKINNQKISTNLFQLSNNRISYGKFISNVSYLFSEQIKYSIYFDMTDYQLNRTSIKLGFWFILYCYCSKYEFVDVKEIDQDFESFFRDVKDDFLRDFLNKNPTIKESVHFEKLINEYFANYMKDPKHFNKAHQDGYQSITSTDVIYIPISRHLKDSFYDDHGIDVTNHSDPGYFDYLLESLLTEMKKNIKQRESNF